MFINTCPMATHSPEGPETVEGEFRVRLTEANKVPGNRIRKLNAGIASDVEGTIDDLNDAVLSLLNDTRRQIVASLAEAGGYQAWHLEQLKKEIDARIKEFTSKAVGLIDETQGDVWDGGIRIIAAPLVAEGFLIGPPVLSDSLLEQLAAYRNDRILGLGRAAADKIQSEILMGAMGEKPIFDVIKAIGRNLKDPSVFTSIAARAEAITLTEMGRVFGISSFEALNGAAQEIPGLEKEWIHSSRKLGARVRFPRGSHLRAHGQRVPVNKPFKILDLKAGGIVKMMHPHDPKAPADQVIRCRCGMTAYHPDWEKSD